MIPSIETLRQRPGIRALLERYGHAAVVAALREETDALRRRVAASVGGTVTAGAPAGAATSASLSVT